MNLHQAGIPIRVEEAIPSIAALSRLSEFVLSTRNEIVTALEIASKGEKILYSVVECVVLKEMIVRIGMQAYQLEYLGAHGTYEVPKLLQNSKSILKH